MDSISSEKVRGLQPEELGLELFSEGPTEDDSQSILPPLQPDDPVFLQVIDALDMNFAGVIFSGPPGTGKTWYVRRIAEALAEDPGAVKTVQFHPSYQYEDFMEGYAPNHKGDFELEPKIFPTICKSASENSNLQYVLVIEEISRCDVARVLGEALTYVEKDKRGIPFTLASGSELVVPENLLILATMNPWDKGVDELDVALERRFAQIDMPPDSEALKFILEENGADSGFISKVVTFFDGVQKLEDEMCHLGHAYFRDCINENQAQQVWNFRLHPFFKRACRLDRETLSTIERMWNAVTQTEIPQGDPPGGDSASPPVDEPI